MWFGLKMQEDIGNTNTILSWTDSTKDRDRQAMLNDLDLVAFAVDRLAAAGAPTLVFGGWAEELTGLVAPRSHADIDLLLPAPSLAAADRLVAAGGAFEIRGKRFAHKRAFVISGVTVEVTLVQNKDEAPVTHFWGDIPYRWLVPLDEPEPVLTSVRPLAVVSRENLIQYRRSHHTTQPWRWRDPASLVD
jgi:hypothetical protein